MIKKKEIKIKTKADIFPRIQVVLMKIKQIMLK